MFCFAKYNNDHYTNENLKHLNLQGNLDLFTSTNAPVANSVTRIIVNKAQVFR